MRPCIQSVSEVCKVCAWMPSIVWSVQAEGAAWVCAQRTVGFLLCYVSSHTTPLVYCAPVVSVGSPCAHGVSCENSSREYDISDCHECSLDFLETSDFYQFSSKVPHTRRLDPDLAQISTRPRSSTRPRPPPRPYIGSISASRTPPNARPARPRTSPHPKPFPQPGPSVERVPTSPSRRRALPSNGLEGW